MRRIASLGSLVLLLLLPAVAAAQDATSQPTLDVPTPDECTVAPRTLAEVQALYARPATPAAATVSPTPASPSTGTPVDAATADAVKHAVREFIACFNAGDFWRQMATYSDRYVQVYLQAYLDPATGINQDIYDLYATPRPIEAAHRTALIAIDQMARLADGRVTALVTADDPADDIAPGQTRVYLVKNGDRWQIDDFAYVQPGG